MKIIVDAGHGFETPGKRTPDGMKEYEFNREVANEVKRMLTQYENVEVYFTHSDSRDVPLAERTKKANQLKADLFLSIHANAYGTGSWNEANGIETYIYTLKDVKAYGIAKLIHKYLIHLTRRKDRGVKAGDFLVLRETKMTAILCECGFMTHREEALLLKSTTYRKTCAEAILKGLVEFYNLKLKSVGLWKVQVGAFSKKENAETLAGELKENGYQAFVFYDQK